MAQQEQIAIIGTGSLGGSLAKAFHHQGHQLVGLYNRSIPQAAELASELGTVHTSSKPDNTLYQATLIVITVSDDQIEQVAQQLAEQGWGLASKTVIHCSGVHTSELLDPLARQGANVASFHPLQSFGKVSDPQVFEDCYFSVEGDAEAKQLMRRLGSQLGANVIEIDRQTKAHLHAAAAMASNYLVALLHTASEVATDGSLEQPQVIEMLMPLIRQTLTNIEEYGPVSALSGPIDRGDVETVVKHLALMEGRPQAQTLYRILGEITCTIAETKHPERADQIRTIAQMMSDS